MNTCNNNGCMNMIISKKKYCSHKCYSLDKKNKSSHMSGKKHSEETKNKISKKNLEVAKDPKDRINYFKNYGYDTLIIWESELKNVDNLKNKLGVFING